jgi:hypothetical protein
MRRLMVEQAGGGSGDTLSPYGGRIGETRTVGAAPAAGFAGRRTGDPGLHPGRNTAPLPGAG